MKVAFYISDLSHGGAQRVIVNLANAFMNNGHDVYVLTTSASDWEYKLEAGVKRIILESKARAKNAIIRNIKRITKLRNVCKEIKPDTLISFMTEQNVRAAVATKGLDIKTILSVRCHPQGGYKNNKSKIITKLLYRLSDGVIFQTKETQACYPKSVQRKSRIIMNQVDSKFFKIQQGEGEYYVALGRLEKQKNYPMMINGFSEFIKEYPGEKLRIYGVGKQEDNLKELIKELGAENNIFMMGSTDDVPSVLKNAKGFVMTSDFEGMPNSLLEAMASGLPCISTDCAGGGARAVIGNGEGILIPVNDTKALTEALIKITKDEDFKNLLIEKSKKKSLEFLPEKIYKDWEDYVF